MIKKLLFLLVLLLTAATGAWAQPWTSGDCTVTLSDGVLIVSGKGAMADYQYPSDRPWDSNKGVITSVVVESGVTTVGARAFCIFENMTSVTLPEGLTSIGTRSFLSCGKLTSVTIPSTVTSIDAEAFFSCTSVTDVNLYPDPANLTWNEDGCDDFNRNPNGSTKCHVLAEHLSAYETKFSGKVNVTFEGDLKPLAPSTTYSVTLAEDTEDAGNWKVKVGEGQFQELPAEAAEGATVTATYNGEKKVKSVKAVKKAAVDPAKAYLTWDADQKKLVATEIPATAIKVASADAGVTWEAGTYVVEGNVEINGTIRLNGDVDLIIKDDAELTANKIQGGNKNLRIYGQANKSGQLVVNSTTDAISNITTLEVHSAKVTATASANNCGGILNIGTFNVYGGLVDAKSTGSRGYGITLKENGYMNIYGGEVKAEGKGNNVNYSYGIRCGNSLKATVTVYGGKLWAGNADNKALKYITLAIDKSLGFNGEIQCSPDNSTWNPTVGTPDEKYVRVGY